MLANEKLGRGSWAASCLTRGEPKVRGEGRRGGGGEGRREGLGGRVGEWGPLHRACILSEGLGGGVGLWGPLASSLQGLGGRVGDWGPLHLTLTRAAPRHSQFASTVLHAWPSPVGLLQYAWPSPVGLLQYAWPSLLRSPSPAQPSPPAQPTSPAQLNPTQPNPTNPAPPPPSLLLPCLPPAAQDQPPHAACPPAAVPRPPVSTTLHAPLQDGQPAGGPRRGGQPCP